MSLIVPVLNDAAALALAGMYEEADSFIHEVSSERYALFPTLAQSDSLNRLTVRPDRNRLLVGTNQRNRSRSWWTS